MRNIIKNILILENKFYVIGVSNKEDNLSYSLLTIELKGEELKIEDRYTHSELDDTFLKKVEKDYPVLLYIEGDNVINKIVDNTVGYRNNLIFKANPDDFYFYEYHQGDKVYASVCRKTSVSVHIDTLKKQNLFIYHVAFGPFVMANLLPLLKGCLTIQSKYYAIELLDNRIVAFKNKTATNERYTINEETFTESEIPLLASFFNYKYPNKAIEEDGPDFNVNKSEYKYKKRFKIAGILALVFIISLLFTSHYLKGYYQEQLTLKRVSFISAQKMAVDVSKLQEEVALKEKILLDNRINNKNFITKYISELSNSISNDITLKTIAVFPEIKKIRPNEKINLRSDIIIIEGETLSDDSFNTWVKQLEAIKWIEAFEIVEYNQSDKNINTFKIETKL